MTSKNVAIIGGSGFVGSTLCKILDNKKTPYSVHDVIETGDKYLDVEKISTFNLPENTEIIINLAAIHHDDVKPISRYDDVNIEGAKNICKFASLNNINKIIFTSSVAIYGFAPPNTDENGKPNYFNDYGRTKYEAEKVFKDWQKKESDKRSLIIIRPTVIFGEGNRGNVYNLLKQIQSKRFVMIGKGDNKKSMAYVENVAEFIDHCTTFSSGIHIYNYVDKPDLDMNNLVEISRKFLFGKNSIGIRIPAALGLFIGYLADIFTKVTRKKIPISSIRVKKFLGTTQFNSSYKKTGFSPSTPIDEALKKTLNHEFKGKI